MLLRILHQTQYRYSRPVSRNVNELRLHPASGDPQRIQFCVLKVLPAARLRTYRDLRMNRVHFFEIHEPHEALLIELQARVRTQTQYPEGRLPLGTSFDDLGEAVPDAYREFLLGSRYVSIDPDFWRLAIDIREDRTDVFETARAIMSHIHTHWRYEPQSTVVNTHALEVLKSRRGVCQDFSHLMLSLCRTLGIPARYVSGYLFNGNDAHLRGAQASHAWCEVWLPGLGWYGLDPTNNQIADERYVKIATGRDYHDAAPVTGTFFALPDTLTTLSVHVEVVREHE